MSFSTDSCSELIHVCHNELRATAELADVLISIPRDRRMVCLRGAVSVVDILDGKSKLEREVEQEFQSAQTGYSYAQGCSKKPRSAPPRNAARLDLRSVK